MSDLHIGHRNFDRELFEAHREAALKARARVIFMGDALEAVTTGSKVANLGGQYEQTMSVGEQEDAFIDYMAGLRVLALIPGNHERRVTRVTGTCPLRNVARAIAAQQHYPCEHRNHGTFVDIRLGRQRYLMVAHHGEGGPTTFFRYLMRDYPGADVYCGGHTHELGDREAFVNDHRTGGMRRVRLVRTGNYLPDPSYAKDRPPTDHIPATGSFLMTLRPDRHHVSLERLNDRL